MNDENLLAFKKFINDDLGLTKENIRDWIKEAIAEQIKEALDNENNKSERRMIGYHVNYKE